MNTAKTIVTITDPLEMAGFIKSNGTQCRFVSIVTNTPVVKIRKGNPFGALRKVSRKNGIVNANYNTSVRNRIADKLGVKLVEVEYENGEVWYEHLKTVDGKPLPLVQHKDEAKRQGKLYLQYFPHKAHSVYVAANGDTVADELVKPWLYAESKRPDYKPTVIAVELGNVKEIRASGVIMEAADLDEAEAVLQ
jgi:hypothetical protein